VTLPSSEAMAPHLHGCPCGKTRLSPGQPWSRWTRIGHDAEEGPCESGGHSVFGLRPIREFGPRWAHCEDGRVGGLVRVLSSTLLTVNATSDKSPSGSSTVGQDGRLAADPNGGARRRAGNHDRRRLIRMMGALAANCRSKPQISRAAVSGRMHFGGEDVRSGDSRPSALSMWRSR